MSNRLGTRQGIDAEGRPPSGVTSASAGISRRSVLGAAGVTAGPVCERLREACDAAGVQKRIDEISASSGGVVSLPAGDVAVSEPIILKPNVVIQGAGIGRTRIIAQRPGFRVFDRHGGPVGGWGGLEQLTVHGFGARQPTRGDERDRAVVVGPFAKGWCRDVEVAFSRWVSLTGVGDQFEVSNCWIHDGYRDGIQLNNVRIARVIQSRIARVADDAIACHVGKGQRPAQDRSIYIVGNQITNCTGIKCLGAANAIISKNVCKEVYGYGVFLGVDEHFGEGLTSEANITVSENIFTDTFSLSVVGAGEGLAAIYLSGGSPGLVGNDGGKITHADINIIRNRLTQGLLNSGGHRTLWWVGGRVDATIPSDVVSRGGPRLCGIHMRDGVLTGVRIVENAIAGFAEPVLIDGSAVVEDGVVRGNSVSNCTQPIKVPVSVRFG